MKLIRRIHDDQGRQVVPFESLMNRFFNDWTDPLGIFPDTFFNTKTLSSLNSTFPRIDVAENEKDMIVEASIEGYDPNKVEVEIGTQSIILKGKTEDEREEKDKKYYRRERFFGEFYREIPLPDYLDTSKAVCKAKNGTLMITIPKKEQGGKKQLKVQVE